MLLNGKALYQALDSKHIFDYMKESPLLCVMSMLVIAALREI